MARANITKATVVFAVPDPRDWLVKRAAIPRGTRWPWPATSARGPSTLPSAPPGWPAASRMSETTSPSRA